MGLREGRTKGKAGYHALIFHERLQPARMTGLTAVGTMRAGTGYKYKEVVRKRAEREALVGVECADCWRFYAACQTWNMVPLGAAPHCGHALQGKDCRQCVLISSSHMSKARNLRLIVARCR